MAKENEIVEVDCDAAPEARIWQAVILQTVQEWINGPARLSVQAEQYLFSDNKDFPMVCQSAGLDVDDIHCAIPSAGNPAAGPGDSGRPACASTIWGHVHARRRPRLGRAARHDPRRRRAPTGARR